MVGPRVYHLKQARSYPAFTQQDPMKVMDIALKWLDAHKFSAKRKNRGAAKGHKRGVHVNFVPKFKLFVEQGTNGQYVVRFDYYSKIKLGTAVVVGVLTSGISTVVGLGTITVTLADADHFVEKFWRYIDSLARGTGVTITQERWVNDGKGGMVSQPVAPVVTKPTPPVAPVITKPTPPYVPSSQNNTPTTRVNFQPGQTHVSISYPAYPPQPMPQMPQAGPPPQLSKGVSVAPQPPPQAMYPQPHEYNRPAPVMPQQAPLPPLTQPTPPPTNFQPGQVYGHNAIRSTQSLMPQSIPSVPPPIMSYPPNVQTGGYPPYNSVNSQQPNFSSQPSQYSNMNPSTPFSTAPTTNLPSTSSFYPQANPNTITPQNNPALASMNRGPAPPLTSQAPLATANPSLYPALSTTKSSAPPMATSYPPTMSYNPTTSNNYPSPPSVQSQASAVYPSVSYPAAPSAIASNHLPSAPSRADSQASFNELSSRVAQDRPPLGRNNSQMSQYDLQSFQGGVNNDFNYADNNPWDPASIEKARKESLASRNDNLYPAVARSGAPTF